MKIFRRFFLMIPAAVILGLACSRDGGTGSEDEAIPVYKILFIGNSLSFRFDVPYMFEQLAAADGIDVEVGKILKPAVGLDNHATNPATIAMIYEKDWDFVVLQGSDYAIAFDEYRDQVYPPIMTLDSLIHDNNPECRTILFLDWSIKEGISLDTVSYTYFEFQQMILDGTIEVADSLGMMIAPIGWAFNTVVGGRPDIDLFDEDGAHPSYHGSYLSACVYFSTLYQRSSVGNAYCYALIDEEDGEYLRSVASSIVLNDLARWNLGVDAGVLLK